MADQSSSGTQEGLATTPDSGYEMGESSACASLRPSTSDRSPDRPPDHPADDDGSRSRRARHRSAGGFMLRDPTPGHRHVARRRFAHDAPHPKSRATPTPHTPDTIAKRNRGLAMSSDPALRDRLATPRHQRVQSSVDSDYGTVGVVSEPPNDVDTAQIVNMALSLSESRRMASRGNMARGTPPRLAPVPDGSSASNLRQHLQQQRRSSHTLSPGSASTASPRRASGVRFGSSRLSDSDAGPDGQYHYHFSSSTLSRAQKAKETLELMAEYRRLLPALPPLKSLNASPPRTPSPSRAAKRKAAAQTNGREYNPLQYIRNRRVRARERMVIAGEKQGFGDVQDVREWVDKVRQRSPILHADPDDEEDGPLIPPFPGADGTDSQTSSSPAAAASSSQAAARTRRPRIDWIIEPCDMIADAYWLEQNNHKFLIEDRQWRKILPPPADPSRPISSGNGHPFHATQPVPLLSEGVTESNASTISKPDAAHSTGSTSTRDRAKQKLQNMKAFPHRHTGSLHGHPHRHHHHLHRPTELKRPRRHSAGDALFGGKLDKAGAGRRTRHNRARTPTSNANDLLEMQMMEMVANEAQELEMTEPGVDEEAIIGPPITAHRKSNSTTDTADSDRRGDAGKAKTGSPSRRRPVHRSNDVPNLQPTSSAPSIHLTIPSDADAVEQGTTSGSALSSASGGRHESPTRNALSKFKNAIRDKSGEAVDDVGHDGDRYPPGRKSTSSPEKTSASWRRPSSPAKLPPLERPRENSRTHKRSRSLRHRSDNPGVGLRGLFKGPRLDTVFRGGVFRLNDMLWKKEGHVEASTEPDSTDESESERTRGRSRISSPFPGMHDENRPGPRNFLEFMPEFSHAPGAQSRNQGDGCGKETATSSPSRSSRPSSQMEPVKQPMSGVWRGYRSASASPSPFSLDVRRVRGGDYSDTWDSESYQGSGGGEGTTETEARPVVEDTESDKQKQKQKHQHQHCSRNQPTRARGTGAEHDDDHQGMGGDEPLRPRQATTTALRALPPSRAKGAGGDAKVDGPLASLSLPPGEPDESGAAPTDRRGAGPAGGRALGDGADDGQRGGRDGSGARSRPAAQGQARRRHDGSHAQAQAQAASLVEEGALAHG
ncbi:hypothetical protein XA68_16889 [Ophiocordyceps unilateralis]|uniref:Uncharacterized protein n=1 Tax=Ophiocordyceps unilateralis TaxID=268505 RepID=A0A2A9P4F0_OPHUN|nr:hypothetical protein XA68_16889 [Ophiocordyceps unilateralis]